MKKRLMMVLLAAVVVMAVCACSGPSEEKLQGTVVDATMNTLTIQTDDGQEYTFATEDADTSGLADGLTIGNKVLVTYTGEIKGTDASGAAVTSIADA